MSQEEGIFKSARDALAFALNFSAQQYDRPAMSKAAASDTGSGRGLGGLNGAGQAGMVRAELQACGRLYEAILIVQFAPRGVPCSCRKPCCSGSKPNRERQEALNVVTMEAVKVLAGCVSEYRVRSQLVEAALLHKKPGVTKMADAYGRDRDTIASHSAKIRAWLQGDLRSAPPVIGMEQRAWDAFSSRIGMTGMLAA